MVDYNTHGGYFAPQGLLKINEGGSHEENPNGGVQLGVDGQGIPNLVEEDEVVYKDFVYSDNIKADGEFLEENHLPKKYADKFYSEIAEALCDEIGEQTDPIALNGLNVMLGRLAEAQEAQKAAEEEKALLEELKNMSPEEIAAIQEALAQEAAAQQMPQEQVQPEVAPEMVAPEQMMLEAPMMACGGKMNKYDGGGRKGRPVRKALDTFFNGPEGLNKMEVWVAPGKGDPAAISKAASDVAKYGNQVKELRKSQGFFAPYGSIPMRNLRAAKNELWALKGGPAKLITGAAALAGIGAGAGIIENIDWSLNDSNNTGNEKPAKEKRRERQQEGLVVFDDFANGGIVNKYLNGSRIQFPWSYPQSRTTWEYNPDWGAGRYLPADYDAPYGYVPAPKKTEVSADVEPYYPYIQLPDATYDESGQGRYLPDDYASFWGRIHAPGNVEYFDANFDDNPVAPTMLGEARIEASRPVASSRRGVIPSAPIGMLSNPDLDAIIQNADNDIMSTPIPVRNDPNGMIPLAKIDNSLNLLKETPNNPIETAIAERLAVGSNGTPNNIGGGQKSSPEDGEFDVRLLSPLVDAAMGLANLATPADHYDYTPIRPYLPSGRIRQQYERYNPIDQNMVTNQMLAQANANMRALRNAGLGPSAGANLLAADYNAGLNLGNALANVWDANNQRRNQVIAQNNQADAAIADYDWQVELARANALNQFAPYNQRMALQTQMLNNQAEQDKYNAIAASINSGKKFLNDYGWESMNRNMVNTNRGLLGYGIDRMNHVVYDKNGNPILLAKCGGKINKKK